MGFKGSALDAGALCEWLEHAAGLASEIDIAQERVDAASSNSSSNNATSAPLASSAPRRKRSRALAGILGDDNSNESKDNSNYNLKNANKNDVQDGSASETAVEAAKLNRLQQEFSATAQALRAALRSQRPLADAVERDAAWKGDGSGSALVASGAEASRGDKARAKAQRRWHVLLGETANRNNRSLQRLIGGLAADSLAQCSVRDVDENFAVYMETVNRLAARAGVNSPAVFARALVEVVRARDRQATTTAALSSDSQAQISQIVVVLARGFRALAEASAVGASWGSAGGFEADLDEVLEAIEEILRINPSVCRNAASQVDQACKLLIAGSAGPQLQARAARVMARLPVAYGGNTSVAWEAVTSICVNGMVDLLKSLYKVKVRGVLAQRPTLRARKVQETGQLEETPESSGSGKVSDFFPGLQGVPQLSKEVHTGSFALASAISPATAYQGLSATLGNALRVAQGGLFLEITTEPLVELLELGLAATTCAKHPSFAQTAGATLSCLADIAAVAGLKLLRHRSTLTGLMERLLALPPSSCPVQLECAVLDACRSLSLAFGPGIGTHVAEACLGRTAELVTFVCEGHVRDQDEKVAQNVASQIKGRASKKRRVAARAVSRAPSGPGTVLVEMEAAKTALHVSSVLLTTIGADLSRASRDMFDAALLDALQPILGGSSILLNEVSASTRDADFRLALLKALQASVLAPVLRVGTSSATPTALVIFGHCLRDPVPPVVEFAYAARASCLAILHPVAPVVGAPRRLEAYVDNEEEGRDEDEFVMPAISGLGGNMAEEEDEAEEMEDDNEAAITTTNTKNASNDEDEEEQEQEQEQEEDEEAEEQEQEQEQEQEEDEEAEDKEEQEEDDEAEEDEEEEEEEEEVLTSVTVETKVISREIVADNDSDDDSDLPSIVDGE